MSFFEGFYNGLKKLEDGEDWSKQPDTSEQQNENEGEKLDNSEDEGEKLISKAMKELGIESLKELKKDRLDKTEVLIPEVKDNNSKDNQKPKKSLEQIISELQMQIIELKKEKKELGDKCSDLQESNKQQRRKIERLEYYNKEQSEEIKNLRDKIAELGAKHINSEINYKSNIKSRDNFCDQIMSENEKLEKELQSIKTAFLIFKKNSKPQLDITTKKTQLFNFYSQEKYLVFSCRNSDVSKITSQQWKKYFNKNTQVVSITNCRFSEESFYTLLSVLKNSNKLIQIKINDIKITSKNIKGAKETIKKLINSIAKKQKDSYVECLNLNLTSKQTSHVMNMYTENNKIQVQSRDYKM